MTEEKQLFKKDDIIKPNGLFKKSRGQYLEPLLKLQVVRYYKPYSFGGWSDNKDPVLRCKILEKSNGSYPKVGSTIDVNAKGFKKYNDFDETFDIY